MKLKTLLSYYINLLKKYIMIIQLKRRLQLLVTNIKVFINLEKLMNVILHSQTKFLDLTIIYLIILNYRLVTELLMIWRNL